MLQQHLQGGERRPRAPSSPAPIKDGQDFHPLCRPPPTILARLKKAALSFALPPPQPLANVASSRGPTNQRPQPVRRRTPTRGRPNRPQRSKHAPRTNHPHQPRCSPRVSTPPVKPTPAHPLRPNTIKRRKFFQGVATPPLPRGAARKPARGLRAAIAQRSSASMIAGEGPDAAMRRSPNPAMPSPLWQLAVAATQAQRKHEPRPEAGGRRSGRSASPAVASPSWPPGRLR